jgi:hypothetical protein
MVVRYFPTYGHPRRQQRIMPGGTEKESAVSGRPCPSCRIRERRRVDSEEIQTHDLFVALSFAAAAARTLELGTGVALVPQRDAINFCANGKTPWCSSVLEQTTARNARSPRRARIERGNIPWRVPPLPGYRCTVGSAPSA